LKDGTINFGYTITKIKVDRVIKGDLKSGEIVSITEEYYIVVMTFYSLGPAGNITQTSHRDDIDISMINVATGNSVANSSSAVNNVEIIEYTFVATGWYNIRLNASRVLAFSPGVVAVVTWTLI